MAGGIVVVKQQQVTAQDSTGAYVPAVRVTFTVDGQGPFSIDVPVSNFTKDYVNQQLAQYAAHIRGVAAITTT